MQRIDKFLAGSGYTRSQAKELIKKNRVFVDGILIKDSGFKIDENQAEVLVDNERINYSEFEYYMLNKPKGYLSATEDRNQPVVCKLIDSTKDDLFPVGRLDKDTEGLLIITNDGNLAHNLLSPRKHVDKKYFVRVDKTIEPNLINIFSEGININNEYITKPSLLQILDSNTAYVTIREGKYHQIKRMFKANGLTVTYLKRISIKDLVLDESLEPGQSRSLTKEEIKGLKEEPL